MKRTTCVQCRGLIPKERRAALPDAVLCVACARGGGRKVTDRDVQIDGADRAEVLKSAESGGFGNENG